MILFDSLGNEIKKIARTLSDVIVDDRQVNYQLLTTSSELILYIENETSCSFSLLIGTSIILKAEYSIDGVTYYPISIYSTSANHFLPTINASGGYEIFFPSGTCKLRLIPNAIIGTANVCLRTSTGNRFNINQNIVPNLAVTVTAAVGALAKLSIPAVAGFNTYINYLSVSKFASAALPASASPILVVLDGISINPIINFGASSELQGTETTKNIAVPFKVITGTAFNITMPATTGVIWRANALYYQK